MYGSRQKRNYHKMRKAILHVAIVSLAATSVFASGGAATLAAPTHSEGATKPSIAATKLTPPARTPSAVLAATRLASPSRRSSFRLSFTVTNGTKDAIQYEFSSAKQFDISITDSNAKEIWRQSDGKMYAQLMTHLTLPPGRSREWTTTWRGTSSHGDPVPPGTYTVTAVLTQSPRYSVSRGFAVDMNPDPTNQGMATKTRAETGAAVQTDKTPPVSARTTITIK